MSKNEAEDDTQVRHVPVPLELEQQGLLGFDLARRVCVALKNPFRCLLSIDGGRALPMYL